MFDYDFQRTCGIKTAYLLFIKIVHHRYFKAFIGLINIMFVSSGSRCKLLAMKTLGCRKSMQS